MTRATTLRLRRRTPVLPEVVSRRSYPNVGSCPCCRRMFHQLNDTAKFIDVALNERSTNAMAHIPGCFLGAETHRPDYLEGAHALFADRQNVGDAIPVAKRFVGVLENGSDYV
jgi:hypothetical protein